MTYTSKVVGQLVRVKAKLPGGKFEMSLSKEDFKRWEAEQCKNGSD